MQANYKKLVNNTKETVTEFIQKISKNNNKVDVKLFKIDNTTKVVNNLPSNQGFDTFKQFKKEFGSAGDGREWHHIVEQSQIKKSGFSPQSIHNTSNMISLDKSTHRKITGFYNKTTLPFTAGSSVRNWLANKSFEEQFEFGTNIVIK